jgi:hypothetical protein
MLRPIPLVSAVDEWLWVLSGRNVPRPAKADKRGEGHNMIIPCREAPPRLSRPNGVGGELHSFRLTGREVSPTSP